MYGLGCCCNTECEVDSTKHTCRGTLPMAPDQKLGIKLSHEVPGFRQGELFYVVTTTPATASTVLSTCLTCYSPDSMWTWGTIINVMLQLHRQIANVRPRLKSMHVPRHIEPDTHPTCSFAAQHCCGIVRNHIHCIHGSTFIIGYRS